MFEVNLPLCHGQRKTRFQIRAAVQSPESCSGLAMTACSILYDGRGHQVYCCRSGFSQDITGKLPWTSKQVLAGA
jgi:hypothetical protein